MRKSSLRGCDPRLICVECQAAAIERLRNEPGIAATFQYCQTSQRALFLRSDEGVPDRMVVLKPGDRQVLETRADAYWQTWVATTERKQAEIDGERLQ